jgi:hypothetical protein
MLAVAREKLPGGIPLHLADMSSFELDVKFDVVMCVYQGINHLLSFHGWQGFFDCAYRHLNDGGALIFDIMTTADLRAMAGTQETVQQFGDNYLRTRVRESAGAVFDWTIELELRENGRDELLTEVIRTASFPPEKIWEELSRKFVSIEIIESDGGLTESGTRIWFTGTRPTAA